MNSELNPEVLHKKYKKFVYNQHRFETPSGYFINKLNAVDAVGGDLNKIQFKVDDAWSAIDFSKRPDKNYFDLVKQRAQHIRKKYEYVRFWLSGGLDSYTALAGFIESGSHIDEIVTLHRYLFSPQELCNFEENTIVRKTLELHKSNLLKTKITELHYDWTHLDRVYSPGFIWPRWCFGFGNFEFRSAVAIINPFFEHPKMLSLFDQSIKVADVFGLEKAFVKKINNEWYHVMLDNALCQTIGRPGLISFFIDPDFPDLYVLEAHLRVAKQETRVPHPIYNPVTHNYIRKYSTLHSGTMSEKSVIMEVDSTLHSQTSHLVEKYYASMTNIKEKYPTLIPDNWVNTAGPNGHFGLASSLEKNFNCMYHEITQ